MRETGIFTGTTSSLCLSLRQLPSRYAIRAGRNLPDKEFRYLRHCCYSALLTRTGSGHFCLIPRVATGIGLYLHRLDVAFVEGAWRAVSEDPARISSILRLR